MLTQYTQDLEFTFEIVNKRIETIQNPIVGKRNCLLEILKSNENIYGVQKDLTILQAELGISTLNQYNFFEMMFSIEDPDKLVKLINFIYLQNNIYNLILFLYHKLPIVRKTAFTLLLNGFEINPLVISFFQSAFKSQDPYKILIYPDKNKPDFLTYLNRDVVRWLTSLSQQTGQNKIWQRYSELDVNLSIDTQKKSADVFEESFSPDTKNQQTNSAIVDSIINWLKQLSNVQSTILPENADMKSDKVYSLRYKWLQANSRIKTAHKFIERLIQKWDEKKDSEFTKAFLMFLSGMSPAERHIFFIYGAALEFDNIMSISFRYFTEISPISSENIFADPKISQQYVRAIFQSKYYGESENKLPMFKVINEHFDNLIMQLKEVEGIFIPIQNDKDCSFAVPLIESAKKNNVHQVTYPHHKGYFKSFHFEPTKASNQFAKPVSSEPSSALEIQAISGIAILLAENQSRTSVLPSILPVYERKFKMAFKPSNEFDHKYYKVSKQKTSVKKEKTLADIFGNPTVDKSGFTLEQILNNNQNKKKPE